MEWLVLWIVLIGTAAVPVYALLAIWYRKNYPPKEYDERQELAQGEAAKLSAGIMMIYFLVLFAAYGYRGLAYDTEIPAIEAALAIFVGILFSQLVYQTYCLLKHAALPFHKKPFGTMVSFFFLGVVDLLNYYLRCWLYPGKASAMEGYLYLMIGVGGCYLGVLYLIDWLRQRKEARNGEE